MIDYTILNWKEVYKRYYAHEYVEIGVGIEAYKPLSVIIEEVWEEQMEELEE